MARYPDHNRSGLGSFNAGVARGKREIADHIERKRNEASKHLRC